VQLKNSLNYQHTAFSPRGNVRRTKGALFYLFMQAVLIILHIIYENYNWLSKRCFPPGGNVCFGIQRGRFCALLQGGR